MFVSNGTRRGLTCFIAIETRIQVSDAPCMHAIFDLVKIEKPFFGGFPDAYLIDQVLAAQIG